NLDRLAGGRRGGAVVRPGVATARQGDVGDEQVGRLDVAVDQAALAGVLQPAGRLADVVTRLPGPPRAGLLDYPAQVRPPDVLHGEVVGVAVLAGVVGHDDIRVGQLRRRPDLLVEALDGAGAGEVFLVDDLQGHQPVHAQVAGLVDDAHAPAAQLPQD